MDNSLILENLSEDIYTKYPSLGVPLYSVSQKLNKLTLKTICDQMLTKNEILTYFDKETYNRLAIFTYKNNELKSYVHNKDPTLLWQYSPDELMFGISKIDDAFENGMYIDFPKFTRDFSTIKNDVSRDLDFENNIFMDVKNAYKIFSFRKQCLNPKIKTKEYFNYVIDILTKLDKINLMYLYLMVNATILKLSIDFDTMRLFETDEGEEITYDEYYERTYEEANKIIKLTLLKIDTF